MSLTASYSLYDLEPYEVTTALPAQMAPDAYEVLGSMLFNESVTTPASCIEPTILWSPTTSGDDSAVPAYVHTTTSPAAYTMDATGGHASIVGPVGQIGTVGPMGQVSTIACTSRRKECRDRWAVDEDERLVCAVHAFGKSAWRIVADMVETRSAKQCQSRWKRLCDPTVNRERWSDAEVRRLDELVECYGTRAWAKIASLLGTERTVHQCRDRYALHCDHKRSPELAAPWSEQEDCELLSAVQRHGHAWTTIATMLRRTVRACRRRFERLENE
jgi:hypothetical protein